IRRVLREEQRRPGAGARQMNQTRGNFRITKTQRERRANEHDFRFRRKKLNHTRQMNVINPAQNPKVEHRIREFLKALNSGGGKPIETLTPAEARKVLVDAQASVRLELPACDVETKTIAQDGLKVSLTIVRPAGSRAILPAFIFVHGCGWIPGAFRT